MGTQHSIVMSFVRQAIICVAVIAATVYVWISYVPSAAVTLERWGIADMLGIDVAAAEDAVGGGSRFGGGPAQVVVTEVGQGAIDDRVEAIGDGRALHAATLRAEVSGRIVEVAVGPGRRVDAGDMVLRLDDEAERIGVERARILLEEAREDAARLSRLGSSGAITEVSLREARLAERTAELALRQAEYDLEQRVLEAPISGWAGVIDLSVGDRVSAQDPIVTITDRSAILIDFRVPASAISQIEPGSAISARPLGLPGTDLTGTVRAVDNVVDRDSRTLRVQGRVENADDKLRAGMAFSVTMTFPGVALPSVDPLSVQWSSEGSYVWAVREDRAVRVPIVIRQRNADSVVVEGDLAMGDLVVVEGVQNLRPDAEVTVVPGSGAEAAEAAAGADRARL